MLVSNLFTKYLKYNLTLRKLNLDNFKYQKLLFMRSIFKFLVLKWGDQNALKSFDIVVKNFNYLNSHSKLALKAHLSAAMKTHIHKKTEPNSFK